jgi:F-type H+-transporting ATPase subunit delta
VTGLGKRYAAALLESLGDRSPDEIYGQLEILTQVFRQDAALRRLFENPAITMAEKEAMLKDLQNKAGLDPAVSNFLALLIRNKRIKALPEITDSFRDIRDQALGIHRVSVKSARPLASKTVKSIEKRLSEVLGGKVALETGVEENLLGGIQIQVGSTVYDGSVSRALQTLTQSIVKG